MSAIRAICYYIDHRTKSAQKSDMDVTTLLAKCINQTSNDIKLLSVQIVTYLSVLNNNKRLDDDLLRLFIPMLVNGTREKAPSVRLASEIALVELLQLRSGNTLYEVIFVVFVAVYLLFFQRLDRNNLYFFIHKKAITQDS